MRKFKGEFGLFEEFFGRKVSRECLKQSLPLRVVSKELMKGYNLQGVIIDC